MANKTKSVTPGSSNTGEIQVNFGNVEALKLKLMDEQNKRIAQVADLLVKIDATLIRMESKYDANQESKA